MTKTPKKSIARRAVRKTPTKLRPIAPAPSPAAETVLGPAKEKRIRGRFSLPVSDYALIEEFKAASKKNGLPVKKNELLRAGLRALKSMTDEARQAALSALKPTKPSRRKTVK